MEFKHIEYFVKACGYKSMLQAVCFFTALHKAAYSPMRENICIKASRPLLWIFIMRWIQHTISCPNSRKNYARQLTDVHCSVVPRRALRVSEKAP